MSKMCLFSYKQHILQLCLFKICLTICFSTYVSQFTLTVITDKFRLKSTHWLYAIFSITTVPFPLIFNLLSFIKKKKSVEVALFKYILCVLTKAECATATTKTQSTTDIHQKKSLMLPLCKLSSSLTC